jgi:peptidoglycan/xylan/chitin deacetylase (PgdA/CDA1 family)
MTNNKNKICCLTLDLEADHGLKEQKYFEAAHGCDGFLALVRKHNIPLTVFVLGKILEERNSLIDKFKNFNFEFGLHTYAHQPEEGEEDIKMAFESYVRYFGRPPLGYRGPFGRIKPDNIKILERLGFRYVSSIRPCRITSLRSLKPKGFLYSSRLLEIPVTSLTSLGIPFGMSWLQLSGMNLLKAIDRDATTPSILVFYMHLHDVIHTKAYHFLPWPWRIFYFKNKLNKQPLLDFDRFVSSMSDRGYTFWRMDKLCDFILNFNQS